MGDEFSELEIIQNKELVLVNETENAGNVHDLNHPIGQQIDPLLQKTIYFKKR